MANGLWGWGGGNQGLPVGGVLSKESKWTEEGVTVLVDDGGWVLDNRYNINTPRGYSMYASPCKAAGVGPRAKRVGATAEA
eukprot:767523-Hanusia_phi.AAC.4